MTLHTRSQKFAHAAFARISKYEKLGKEYASFARKFPALIHTCGLAQAVAFALAKKQAGYIEDLAAVLNGSGHPEIHRQDVPRTNTDATTRRLSAAQPRRDQRGGLA